MGNRPSNNLFKIILLFFFVLLGSQIYSQQDQIGLVIAKKPRIRPDAEMPGKYAVVALLNKSELDPGDSLKLSIFFTGYGMIKSAKLFYETSSTQVFDSNTLIIGGMGLEGKGKIFWGKDSNKYSFNKGNVIELTDMGLPINQDDATPFVDFSLRSNVLVTEFEIVNPPLQYQFRINDDAGGNSYKITLYLTYFNGHAWQVSKQEIDFKISSFIDRHQVILWILGILGAISFLDSVTNIFQKLISFTRSYSKFSDKPAMQDNALGHPSSEASLNFNDENIQLLPPAERRHKRNKSWAKRKPKKR